MSVLALKIMVQNMTSKDPPIIVTAQTNHALDQLLRHISVFEPNFVRLGGRTTDMDHIKPRTLFQIKQRIQPSKASRTLLNQARKSMDLARSRIAEILRPLTCDGHPFSPELLQGFGLISQAQCDSLTTGDSEAVDGEAFAVCPVVEIVGSWQFETAKPTAKNCEISKPTISFYL